MKENIVSKWQINLLKKRKEPYEVNVARKIFIIHPDVFSPEFGSSKLLAKTIQEIIFLLNLSPADATMHHLQNT